MKNLISIMMLIILLSCGEDNNTNPVDKTDYSNTIVGDWQFNNVWALGYYQNDKFIEEFSNNKLDTIKLRIKNNKVGILNDEDNYIFYFQNIEKPFDVFNLDTSNINNFDYCNLYEYQKPEFDKADSNNLFVTFELDSSDNNILNFNFALYLYSQNRLISYYAFNTIGKRIAN